MIKTPCHAFDGTLPKVEEAFLAFVRSDNNKPVSAPITEACARTAEQPTYENVKALHVLLGAYLEEAPRKNYMHPPIEMPNAKNILRGPDLVKMPEEPK